MNQDKAKLKDLVGFNKSKSMREIVQKLLSEKLKIEYFLKKKDNSYGIEIPDYIPETKYVGFVNGSIIAIRDTIGEVAQVAAEIFPNGPLVIKYNGSKWKLLEYYFLNLTTHQYKKYINV